MSLVSYLPYYDALLQNANAVLLQNATKAYYKFRNLFRITKCGSFIKRCNSYYKIRRFFYKMWQLLRNKTESLWKIKPDIISQDEGSQFSFLIQNLGIKEKVKYKIIYDISFKTGLIEIDTKNCSKNTVNQKIYFNSLPKAGWCFQVACN